MALGVLAHVAAEYIVNLGRTLRFYSDRYGSTMTAEVRLSPPVPCADVAVANLAACPQRERDPFAGVSRELRARGH